MTSRETLPKDRISPEAVAAIAAFYPEVIAEVSKAIQDHKVVVVGMASNPFVRKVRAELTKADVSFHFIEYGGYTSQWKKRLAIKMWSGWPTFPQVFVNGVLIGGYQDTVNRLAAGSLLAK